MAPVQPQIPYSDTLEKDSQTTYHFPICSRARMVCKMKQHHNTDNVNTNKCTESADNNLYFMNGTIELETQFITQISKKNNH